jgi:hypothetical protein
MPIICSRCGRRYDVTLFTDERTITCACGEEVRGDDAPAEGAWSWHDEEDVRARRAELRRGADRVCQLILRDAVPAIDVLLEAGVLRLRARELFPGEEELFERLYGSRFRRLWRQFRGGDPPWVL